MAGLSSARPGVVGQDPSRQAKAGAAGLGLARPGLAYLGTALHGRVWQAKAGKAWQSSALLGWAVQDSASR